MTVPMPEKKLHGIASNIKLYPNLNAQSELDTNIDITG